MEKIKCASCGKVVKGEHYESQTWEEILCLKCGGKNLEYNPFVDKYYNFDPDHEFWERKGEIK